MGPPKRRPAALWVYNILDDNLVDMHGQAVGYRLSGKPDVPVTRQTWNYMVEHLYCMIITIIVFICSCSCLLGTGTSLITHSMYGSIPGSSTPSSDINNEIIPPMSKLVPMRYIREYSENFTGCTCSLVLMYCYCILLYVAVYVPLVVSYS